MKKIILIIMLLIKQKLSTKSKHLCSLMTCLCAHIQSNSIKIICKAYSFYFKMEKLS